MSLVYFAALNFIVGINAFAPKVCPVISIINFSCIKFTFHDLPLSSAITYVPEVESKRINLHENSISGMMQYQRCALINYSGILK